MNFFRRMLITGASLALLAGAGCYSRTVKETTPPVVITQPDAQTSTTTTTSDNGAVVRHSTTTYSNP